jgi:hypothetical protein
MPKVSNPVPGCPLSHASTEKTLSSPLMSKRPVPLNRTQAAEIRLNDWIRVAGSDASTVRCSTPSGGGCEEYQVISMRPPGASVTSKSNSIRSPGGKVAPRPVIRVVAAATAKRSPGST